jgi:hypothetical protein
MDNAFADEEVEGCDLGFESGEVGDEVKPRP